MKKRYLACWLLLGVGTHALASLPNADEIMQKVRNRPDGKDIACDMKLVMNDDQGSQRERDVIYLQKDFGDDEKLTLYFTGPTEVKGVGFLNFAYSEAKKQDDDQWIYLPAFRQVRRIASSDKRGSFMGSEYAYIDIEKVRIGDYTQKVLREDTLNGRPVWVIERTPKNDTIINKTGYYKSVVWVDKERDLILQQTYSDAKGIEFKKLEVKKVEQVDSIWTVMQSDMINLSKNKRSSLIYSNVHYNVNLDDKFFQQSILKTGVKRGNVPALN